MSSTTTKSLATVAILLFIVFQCTSAMPPPVSVNETRFENNTASMNTTNINNTTDTEINNNNTTDNDDNNDNTNIDNNESNTNNTNDDTNSENTNDDSNTNNNDNNDENTNDENTNENNENNDNTNNDNNDDSSTDENKITANKTLIKTVQGNGTDKKTTTKAEEKCNLFTNCSKDKNLCNAACGENGCVRFWNNMVSLCISKKDVARVYE